MFVTWDQYKAEVSNNILNRRFIYRGQSKAVSWKLQTTLHRTGWLKDGDCLDFYFDCLLPEYVQEPLETWLGYPVDLGDPLQLVEFLGLLHHNGFPTPLLDWTFSPYIAAYYAFEGVDAYGGRDEPVCVYAFNHSGWRQKYDAVPARHQPVPAVSVVDASYGDARKQKLQLGVFLFATMLDVEGHIRKREETAGQFLVKYELDFGQRAAILQELSMMGITAKQLSPCLRSVCKTVMEKICWKYMSQGIPRGAGSARTGPR